MQRRGWKLRSLGQHDSRSVLVEFAVSIAQEGQGCRLAHGTARHLQDHVQLRQRNHDEDDDQGQKGHSRQATNITPVPSVDEVNDALANVIDPELGLDFVELGLIYDVEVDGGTVDVTFTLTSPGCPIGPQVTEQIEEFVGEVEGVGSVESTMVFSPPWTPDRMSEDAKFALGF